MTVGAGGRTPPAADVLPPFLPCSSCPLLAPCGSSPLLCPASAEVGPCPPPGECLGATIGVRGFFLGRMGEGVEPNFHKTAWEGKGGDYIMYILTDSSERP